MNISEFVLGVLSTLGVEFVAIVILGLTAYQKKKQRCNMSNKKIKCTVCSHSFKLNKKMVYEVQEESTPTILLSLRKNKIYNAADCPNCGCQMIIKDRTPKVITEIGEDAKI